MWRRMILISILALTFITGMIWQAHRSASAQVSNMDVCANVNYLMARNITPYDMSLSGGILRAGSTENATLGAGAYADFWSFTLTRPRNQNNVLQDLPVTIRFTNVSGALLEWALFNGLFKVIDYQPVINGDIPYSPSAETATYTLVVRKANLSDESTANYGLSVISDGLGQPILSVRDETTNRDFSPAPQISNGVGRISAPAATIFIHLDGTRRVHPRGGQSTQVFMPNERGDFSAHTINIGNWANKLSFLGGDLAAVGESRIYYQESFNPRVNVSGATPAELNLQNVTYADGTIIRTDWNAVFGVWVMDDCVGFKLKDGRTFTASTPATRREIRAEGSLTGFMLAVNTLVNGVASRHIAVLDWTTVRENSQVSLREGVYRFDLVAGRQLTVQSADMTLTSAASEREIAPSTITLNDQAVTIVMNWVNIRAFSLRDNLITFDFLDAPRTSTTRDATNISRIETIDDIIQLIYKGQAGVAGEQRLMLPASDSYIEIVTPAGNPPFNGTVRAGGDGYFARALNNTGGDCYPTNTAIPVANCPPAGHINPANGNIWLPITDEIAFGAMLDLDLTRHYNSAYADLDSPFGKGWSSVFLLDYNVLFDAVTNSRTVTIVTVSSYAIGLDVTYAPRGVVTFITPTGSRHQFVGDSNTLRAVTMPGWRLSRASISDIWRLVQDNGLVFEFDRAGRLLGYGYPTYGRMIKIDYPRTNLNGAADIGADTPVIITDHVGDFAPRQLELYYNSDHRIVKSIMRDMTIGADETTCNLADNCLQTTYTYSPDGLLIGVNYADGTSARYEYDEFGRMARFDDPRAPITSRMNITYNKDGEVIMTQVPLGDSNRVYQQAEVNISANTRIATLTDRLGNRVSYTYTLAAGDLRTVGTTYQLTQTTSPLAGTGEALEDVPTTYRWGSSQNSLLAGFLTRVEARSTGANQGRGSIAYDYTPNGQLRCMPCVVDNAPKFEVIYDRPIELPADVFRPTRVNYADGTTEQFTYDANGLLTRYIDRHGADYTLRWTAEAPYQLAQLTRANDNTTWDYLYNPVGQIVSLVQTIPDDSLPYQVSYQWDGLGRLIGVTDSVLGIYSIQYPAPTADENGNIFTQVHQIDPIGGNTISVFDSRGNLIETRIELDGAIIQKTTRQYDLFGREIVTSEWVGAVGDAELLPMDTITEYIPTTSYSLNNIEVVVRGETVRITDPYGRTSSTIYDALGRVRRTIDPNGTVNDYTYNTTVDIAFGLQITQQTALQGTPFTNRVDYLFDSARQLRRVRMGAGGVNDATPISQQWTLNLSGNTNRLNLMEISVGGRAFNLFEVTWGEYNNGQPSAVNLRLANIPLNSDFSINNNHRPTMNATYDFLGRVTSITTGEGTYNIAYCPVSTGGTLVVYGALGTKVDCAAQNASQTLRYDAHQRLIEAVDAYGRRVITYTPNVSRGVWEVTVTLTSHTGEDVWALQFDSIGNLTQWIDQNDVVHEYTYDTRGRLIGTRVADMPEMSYTFEYNNADQLTRQVDGLERGWLYNYDSLGRVVSKVDLQTADAVSYSYTPNGQLSAITNSNGATTVYLYEDRSNPNRLTRIIEPTGAQHRFTWIDAEVNASITNTVLIHTDPFNNQTRYVYDGTGLLWRIDDPTPRTSEMVYDDGGQITDVLTNVTSATNIARRFTLARPAPHSLTVTDSTPRGTGWSRNLNFYHDGVLAQSGDIQFRYDALGRLVSVNLDGQDLWTIGWATSRVINVTEPFAGASVLSYDAMHRLISRTARDNTITYTYSVDIGRISVMRVDHPIYGVREYAFSPGSARQGQPPTVFLRAHGQETAYIYDGDGRLREIFTRVCSNAQANLRDCIINQAPIYETRATITYNSAGLPIRISDPDGALETFAYDDMGRLIGYQNANGRNFAYGYDNGGRLIRITSATGVKLLMQYNALNNLIGICQTRTAEPDDYATCQNAGGVIETYAYDTLGRLVNRASANTSRNFAYNADSQLTQMGDITFGYIPNLGLLSQMRVTNSAEYTFNYSSPNRLASFGDISFTYSPLGDLLGQNDGITNITINFNQPAQTLSFADSINRLDYWLDARGYLVALAFNNSPIMEMTYPTDQQALDIIWNDTTEIAYTLNNQRHTENLIFLGANDMSIYYDLTGTGAIRKQNIFLPIAGKGYVMIYGYDNDERPVTLRITDFEDKTVLFAQSITYNANGTRESETWQYADGTQVIVRYRYDRDRLSERTVNILANQNRTFRYRYEYDAHGNITRITETSNTLECATLRYDGANRLITVTRPSGSTPLVYDAYGRLTSAGDVRVSYRGSGTDVFAIAVQRNIYYVGDVENQPAQFLVGRGGDVTWLINDGRRRTLLPYTNNADLLNDIWLFDALGRYVPLTTPTFADPCNLSGLPANLTPALSVQPLADGALWLPNLGFYIQNGRSYETETALYTQRATVIDALGNVYASQIGNFAPYPTTQPLDGLRLLREALQRAQINTHLSAQSILAHHRPQIADDTSPLLVAHHHAQTPLRHTSQRLLFLADWLKTRYNLPNAYRDADGYLRLPLQDTPAQGGYGGAYHPPFDRAIPAWHDILMTSVQPTQTILRGLMDDLRPITPLSTYQAQLTPSPLLTQTWQNRTLSAPITADAVLDWLPTPLAYPQYGASALDFADLLANMWTMTNVDWVNERLDAHLPTRPNLPPMTLEDWRASAFREDVLDPLATYGAILPPLPDMPRYRWGANPDWLGIGR